MAAHPLGVTRACGLIGISRSLYRYQAKRPSDMALKDRLSELAAQKRRYGYRRLHVLLRREGWQHNAKRTYRVYHEAGLMVRKRKRKRIAGVERIIKLPPLVPNDSWSMDFVSDGLVDGRRVRCLNIVDDFTKQCLAIEVDTSLPGKRVVNVLQRLAESRGVDDHGRNGRLAQGLEGLESAFTADQQEFFLAIGVLARRDGDRLLQADVFDVANDVIEDPAVALTRVEDLDLVDRNHLEIAGRMFFAHAALLTRVRSAMPWR